MTGLCPNVDLQNYGVPTLPCLQQTAASLSPDSLGRLCLNRGTQVGPSSSTLTSKNGPDFLTTPSQLQKPRLGALWVVYIYV